MGNGRSEGYTCPEHGDMTCPLCGSPLVKVQYKGNKPEFLALMKRKGFCCFVGCICVDLHDKVVDGVSHRNEVFVTPIFHDCK